MRLVIFLSVWVAVMVAPGTGRLEKVTWPECWEAREGEMKRSKRGREFSDRRRKGVFCGTDFFADRICRETHEWRGRENYSIVK